MKTTTNSQQADAVKNRRISDILINDANLKFKIKPSIKSEDGFRLDVSINVSKASPEIQDIIHDALSSKRSFRPFLTASNGNRLDNFTISSEFFGFSFSNEPNAKNYTYKDFEDKEIRSKFINQFAQTQLVAPLKSTIIDCLSKERMLEIDMSSTRIPQNENSPTLKEKIQAYIAKVIAPTNTRSANELGM